MRLAVLVDDREGEGACTPEHGLSLFIEHRGKKILLDFGQTDGFIRNAQKLGIDLESIDAAVLSHGHYDHADGLKFIKEKKLICHPECFLKRYSKETGRYDGVGISLEQLSQNNEVILTKEPYEIARDIFFLGQIPRVNDFECKQFPTVLENGEIDELFDDSALAVKTENGVIVLAGCAHSGICNIIEYAKKVTGCGKVYAVIGGFHLREVNEDLKREISSLKSFRPVHLLMGHCTCDEACLAINREMWDKTDIQVLGAGNVYEI